MMERAEHLARCKQRALEYLDAGNLPDAVASMLSDMEKHPDTGVHPALGMLGMRYITDGDAAAVRRWITGFN